MQAYIGRQVIIDRDQNILGYELLFRHAANATQAHFDNAFEAGAQVISTFLTQMGTDWRLGDNLAVINVTSSMLDSELLELLPPTRIVLEIIDPSPSQATLTACRELRAKGYALAFNDTPALPIGQPWLELADYLYFSVRDRDLAALAGRIRALGRHDAKLIAKCLETPGEFKACLDMGFDYFQGHHFARPETLSIKTLDPAYGRMIDLLNLVRTNADTADIETAIKRDVALPARLIQYINSVGFGASRPVYSIRQALAIMGYRQLYRWLSLLVVTSASATTPPALARMALIRARLMEQLGQLRLIGTERDNLFVVGLFSLLNVILDMPMETLLQMLSPPDTISAALLHRQGPYGAWLALAEACENIDAELVDTLARQLTLSAEQVNHAHLDALAWVEELAA